MFDFSLIHNPFHHDPADEPSQKKSANPFPNTLPKQAFSDFEKRTTQPSKPASQNNIQVDAPKSSFKLSTDPFQSFI